MRRAKQAAVLAAVVGLVGLTLVASDAKKPAIKAAPKAAAPRAETQKPAANASATEAELRKSAAAFAAAYADHDAKAIAAGFTPDGEFITEDGTVLSGRDEIQTHFTAVFQNLPEARVRLQVDTIRIVAQNVALEEGTAETILAEGEEPQTSRYVVLHVRQDGEWLVARTRDFPAEAPPITAHDRLRALEWLVGEWVDESPDALITTSCRWAEGNNFLLQEFTARIGGRAIMNGSTRIGWDPLAKQFRSWTFDSAGGFSEGVWTPAGDAWVLKAQGVTNAGEVTSATTTVRLLDANTISWESRDRVVGDQIEDDVAPILVKRRGPRPAE